MVDSGMLETFRKESIFQYYLHQGETGIPDQLKEQLAAPVDVTKDIKLTEGSMFDYDFSEITHIYTNSLSFNKNLLRALGKKIAEEAKNLKVIVSLKRFPDDLKGFERQAEARASMTWTRMNSQGSSIHVYKRVE
eukprot:TRINITY_DN14855_c0_g1_i3.p1 TRINITY_DN14855_c0_g1~~TRINITY_DN14855_c0_g1_i3.p1  ORF type:complete len:135 (+),score=20.30 TRINITY_DN14855_c0_g1_i3:334-738(+)